MRIFGEAIGFATRHTVRELPLSDPMFESVHRNEDSTAQNRRANAFGYAVPKNPSNADSGHPFESLHLVELVPVLRRQLKLDHGLSDATVLDSLKSIAAHSARQDRWRAAFDSVIGRSLAHRGADLNTALNIILAALPSPRL